jgi:divalent metal cation (Fe/Co/Zn/Cd) transporter
VVAILIFAGGAGISVYEGIDKLRYPHPVSNPVVNYAVLGAAMVFEGIAWIIAFREFGRMKGRRGFFEEVRRSKDPTVFTILFEDSAAMLGLLVAFTGIAAGEYWGIPEYDGIASIGIGVILAVTAALLAYETKGLLIGEGAAPETVAGIRRLLAGHAGIIRTNEVLTLHFGPKDVLVTLSVDFSDALSSADVEAAISELETAIKAAYPEVNRVFIEAQSWTGHRASLQAE